MTNAEIEHAFPDDSPYLEPVTGIPLEIFDIARDLAGKSWKDINAKICNRNTDAFSMLDLKPLRYFLPAFLLTALNDPKSVTAEALVYFVCQKKSFAKFAKLLNHEQISAVLLTVESIMNCDQGYHANETSAFLETRLRYLGEI